MYCSDCGTRIDEWARYCHTCGLEVDTEIRNGKTSKTGCDFDAYDDSVQPRGEVDVSEAHPWRRFFARLVEFNTIGLIPIFFVSMVLVPQNVGGFNDLIRNPVIAALIAMLMWLPFEAFLISATGTTPIKWLFGIRIVRKDGNPPPFTKALFRSMYVLGPGQGFYIPIVNLIAYAFSYNELIKKGSTSWDSLAGVSIKHRKTGLIRGTFCTVSLVTAILVATGLSTVYAQLSSSDQTNVVNSMGFSKKTLQSNNSESSINAPRVAVASVFADEPDLYQRLGIAPADLGLDEKKHILRAHFRNLEDEYGNSPIYRNENEFYDFYIMVVNERKKTLPRDLGDGLKETKIVFQPESKMTLLEMTMPVVLGNVPNIKDQIPQEVIRTSICKSAELNSLFVAIFDGKIHINLRDINGELIYSDDIYQRHCQRILNGERSDAS